MAMVRPLKAWRAGNRDLPVTAAAAVGEARGSRCFPSASARLAHDRRRGVVAAWARPGPAFDALLRADGKRLRSG